MSEQQQKSDLTQAANTAHAIRSAVKTGKAIAGGPYGAAVGLAMGSRSAIGKIVIAVIALLMLPVLFILMLPALIFGGLTSSSAPSSTEPVLNDNAAITQNINDIAFSINQVLGEGITDAESRIADDFAGTGGDQYEIINPYEGNMISNVNSFLGQYCAAKDQDWKNISLADLEETLRQGKSSLYTYTRTSEQRVVTDDDPETPDVVETKTITVYIYTIVYQGEAYFEDTIFHLTDEQKELAGDYTQNLSLFLGDGVFQGITSDEAITGIASLGDVRFTDGATEVVYFNQLDERYCNEPYGTDHIGGYGCGPTVMAMVVSSLTSDAVEPTEMAQWAYEHNYWCSKSGSYHSLIPGAAEAWGLAVSGCTAAEPQRIVDALSDGKLVVALMTKGHFTRSGHFILLRGVKSEKILVADPASYSRSQQVWDLSIILSEASRAAGAGGPFWIVG